MKIKNALAGALFSVAGLCALLPGSASAAIITGTDSDFNYSFSEVVDGITLSGTVMVDVTSFNTVTNQLTMTVTLTNTTADQDGTNRWIDWGFGSDPNVLSASFTDSNDGAFRAIELSFIPGLSLIEVCTYAGTNNCQSANAGLAEGAADTFSITLTYADLTATGVSLDPFGVRYASIGLNDLSQGFYTPPGDTPVPEPTSLALLSLGLLGLAGAKWKGKGARLAS